MDKRIMHYFCAVQVGKEFIKSAQIHFSERSKVINVDCFNYVLLSSLVTYSRFDT